MAFPILSMVLSGVAFLAGLPLNGYVLFITSCCMGRTASAVWFLNRAMADLIFIVFLPLRFIYILNTDNAKILNNTVTALHMFSSAFLLTALSVDRCLLLVRPEWTQNLRTARLALMIIMGIWALSLGFSLRYGDLWEFLLSPAGANMNVQLDEGRVKAAVAIQFLVGFLIPLALILIPTFYVILAAKLRGNRLTQSTRPLRILLGLIPTFFLCWLPYHVFSFLLISPKYPLISLVTESNFACLLAYLSSFLNPIFYLTMEEEFLKYWQRARNPQTTNNSEPETAE